MTAPPETLAAPEHKTAERLGNLFSMVQEGKATEEGVLTGEEVEETAETEEEPVEPEAEETTEEEPTEEEEEAEAKPDEEKSEEEAEEKEVSNLDEWAEAFGVDRDVLTKHIQVEVGDETMPLADALERAGQAPAPAQMAEMLAQKSQEIAAQEAKRQEEFTANQNAFLASIHTLIGVAHNGLGVSDAALAHLRETDPSEWAVKSEERRQLDALLDRAMQEAAQYQVSRQQQQNEAFQTRIAQEGCELLKKNPEWKDEKQALWDATLISQTLQDKYGFTPEEIGGMFDHRLALVFQDAHRFHKIIEGSAKAKKTLTLKKQTAQKSLVPTRPRKAKGDPRKQARAAALKQFRATRGDPTAQVASAVAVMGDFLDGDSE